jgi:2-alkenal reductase
MATRFRQLFALFAALAFACGVAGSAVAQEGTPSPVDQSPAPVSWVDVVQQVRSSVVTVVNEQQASGFGQQQPQEAGRGTGFFIDDQGHIVTNWHVVTGGDTYEVILADGSKRGATLVGADRLSDLAVVQIEGESPGSMAWGDSSELQPGQPVLAIGSPLGAFTNTVTDGIVSALGRDFPGSAGEPSPVYNNLIQHNADINPGNSGGPLIDLAGDVVGINTLGIAQVPGQSTPAQGLFFAIPANTARQIVDELIADGRVSYPFMGVSVQPVTEQISAQYDLPVDHGVYVQQVTPGGPAGSAGIQTGDFIVALGGEEITEDRSFTEALFSHEPGESVDVTINRDGQEQQVQVTLAERPVE